MKRKREKTRGGKKEKEKKGRMKGNKYRGGIYIRCDYFIVTHCIMMSFDDFYPQKRPYSSSENNTGHTDLRTDRRTDTTS